jgi:hypothetical protein
MVWNKGRLAYAPLGPYVAKRYKEGASYGKIAQEVGVHKGCVQNLCRAIGVTPRENHTTNIADVWEQRLTDYVSRTGAKVIRRPDRLTKKSRILTECKHGTSERPCQVLRDLRFCCKSGSKTGFNNPGEGWGVRPRYRCLPGVLYLIRYLDESGTHFKIGITKLKLAERFRKGQLVSIIRTWNLPLGQCFDLEQAALRHAAKDGHRYSSPTTTELIHPAGLPAIIEFVEQSLM